jgi:uncharacterized protein (DUF2147 family)
MRIQKAFCALILAMLSLPVIAAPLSPEGLWTTIDDSTGKKRAVVRLAINNGMLGGTIEKVYQQPGDTGFCAKCPGEFKDKPIQGLKFVWDLKENSPGTWEDGYILDGKVGKIYRVKMTMKENKLYVRGYVGVAMLGRTQIWERPK